MITSRRRVAIIAAAVVSAAVVAGGGVAFALNDDGDANATGPEADRAVAAALAHVGGSAQGVEREGGASWEVEVVTKAGRPVEVLLDGRFRVVAVEGDAEDHDGPDDD
jgi:hypothetical protein